MAQWLKQSTAFTFRMGPFVDDTDGKTAETGLTLSQADFRLSKAGGAFAQKNDATSGSHDENGYYTCILNTTDTNTLGTLDINVSESGALPVFKSFMVVPAQVWDSYFGADVLQVDVAQFGNSNGTFSGGRAEVNLSHIAGSAVSTTTAQLGVNVVQISGDATSADNLESYTDGTTPAPVNVTQFGGSNGTFSGGRPEVNTSHAAGTAWNSGGITANTLAADTITAAKVAADVTTELQSGLATSAALTTVSGKIDTIDDFLDTEIAAIKAKTDSLTFSTANRVDAQLFGAENNVITAASINADAITAAKVAADVSAEIADAVWEEAIADHSGTTGSTAEALAAAGSAGDPWSTALPGAYGAGTAGQIIGDALDTTISSRASQASVDTIDDFLDTEVAAILAAVDTEVGAIKTKTDSLTFSTANRVDAQVFGLEADVITNTSIASNAIGATELAGSAGTEIATAVWADAARTLTAIDEDNTTLDLDATIRAAVGLAAANLDTQLDALPTAAELATALGTADDAVLAAIAALNNLSAAQVNAEVVDALATDTYAEPGQGTPAATAALSAKIGYLYKAWRNRTTQTASEYALYADDGTTKDQEAAVSDDGTTFVRGEVATGA